MFTGIIDHTARIRTIDPQADSMTLIIDCQFNDFKMGESIAVDGACLTVMDYGDNNFHCQLSPETCDLTIAQHYQQGDEVNLERAMCLGDRLGGHMVTGHIDQIGTVADIKQHGEYTAMTFSGVDKQYLGLLINKGSITVNGISLTINQVTDDGFEVMLIPHTLQITNLSQLKVGNKVNLEFDYLSKIVKRQLTLGD